MTPTLPTQRSTLLSYLPPVLLGGILRLVWVMTVPHTPIWDEASFHELAGRLSQGGAYGAPFWPPGWPATIAVVYAAFGANPRAVLILNALLSTLLIALFAYWVYRQFDARTALIAAWMMAFTPSYLLASGLMVYETLLQLLLVGALCLSTTAKWKAPAILALALVTAAITLIRPTWALLPLLVFGMSYLNGNRPRFSSALFAQVGAILLVLPWIYTTSIENQRFVPVAMQGGLHLWMANHEGATGTHVDPPSGYFDPLMEPVARAAAIDYLLDHPWHPLTILPAKLYYSFRGEAWSAWVIASAEPPLSQLAQSAITRSNDLVYWLTLLLALPAIVRVLVRREWRLLAPMLLFVILMALQIVLFTGQLKHRWPLDFILIAYAANTLAFGMRWRGSGCTRLTKRV